MTIAAVDRHIACAGVFNLRDLGGYPAGDGQRVRWRMVFRADGLHRMTAGTDQRALALGWRTVVDLRTVAEVEAGRFACDGVEAVHLPILRDTWDAENLAEQTEDAVGFLAARYLEMAEAGANAIATAFELLASPPRLPAVFHCSAGKDRTGVLVALVLAALDVDDGHIAADYHLSAYAMDHLVEWITSSRPEVAEHMARQPKVYLACPPEAIVGFLDGLRLRYGSIDGYLDAIGVYEDVVAALRHALLEEA